MTTPFNPSIPFVNPTGSTAPFNPGFTFSSSSSSCAPVNIFDASGTLIAVVASGGSYTTTGQTFTRTITFKAGSTYAVSFVSVGTGIIRVSSSTNITSAVYTNRTTATVLTPPYSVNKDDIVTISITPTNPLIDSVLVLEGEFVSVTVSVTDPNLGGTGQFCYVLNEPARTVSVIDTSTDTVVATVVLDAGALHTALQYRAINDKVYIWGQDTSLNTNTYTLQKIDCTNNTVSALQSFTATSVGAGAAVCAAYNYIRDVFYIVGGTGATCPLIVFDCVTETATFVNPWDMVTPTSVYYMGYADAMEDSFFVCGNNITSVCYKQLSATTFAQKAAIVRIGAIDVVFNRTNRLYYVTDTGGGMRTYNTAYSPETSSISGVNFRRAGLSHNFVQNKITGADIASRSYAVYNVGAASVAATTIPAVGAETAYRSVEYSTFSGKTYISSRAGNIVQVISPATDAVVATITVGNQNTSATGSFNQICFNQLKVF